MPLDGVVLRFCRNTTVFQRFLKVTDPDLDSLGQKLSDSHAHGFGTVWCARFAYKATGFSTILFWRARQLDRLPSIEARNVLNKKNTMKIKQN